MKNKCFFLLSLCTLLVASACSFDPPVPENEFLIRGKLQNVPDSAIIYLRVEEGKLLKDVAKDTVINGEFSLRDTITDGVRELLLMSRSKGFPGIWVSVWVAPGKLIQVDGVDKLLKTWNIKSDIPEQVEENNFVKAGFPEQLDVLNYKAQEYDLLHLMFQEHADDEAFQKESWVQVDSLRKLQKPLEQTILEKELAYLKTAPVTIVWLNKYLQHASLLQWNKENPSIPKIKELYARMSESDKMTEIGQEISEYMNLGTEVGIGDEMVDGDLYDLEGNTRHLSEFKGQYILLDFWSQGCGPCVQSIPEMEEVVEKYKDKLAVISINSDSKVDWKQFVAEKKMTGNQWNELRKRNTGLAARYKVIGIPHYVMISPDGKVQDAWSGYGPGSLKAKVKNLVK